MTGARTTLALDEVASALPSRGSCAANGPCPVLRRSGRVPLAAASEADEVLLAALLVLGRRYASSSAFRVGVRLSDLETVVEFTCSMPSDRSVRAHREAVGRFLASLAPADRTLTFVVGAPTGPDLSASAEIVPAGMIIHLDLHQHVFEPEAGDRMLGHLGLLIGGLTGAGDRTLAELPMLTEAERAGWHRFNDTRRPYPANASIYQLFADQVAAGSDRPAVITDDAVVSYGELARRAGELAGVLTARGLGAGDRIAYTLGRRTEWIVAVLAILRIGGTYVPVDAGLPPARRDFVLADCRARLLMVDDGARRAAVPVLNIADPRMPAAGVSLPALTTTADDEAYVMYTSGTTGQPKGVLVPQRAVVRLVRGSDFAVLSPATRILSTGAIAFDATTFEVWGALLNGGAIVLVPDSTVFEADRLRDAMTRHRADTVWLTSSLFNRLVDQDPATFGRCRVITGGEALSPVHVARAVRACPDATFVNGYGPTENTTFSLTYRIDGEPAGPLPIGRPIANSTAWVLDPDGHPQPIGIPGELYVGGDGLADGYLNRPGLTAEAFTRRGSGERLYRTGDIACLRADGLLDYLGRADDQVKIRGFRVELGEIESHLRALPGVADAVVLLRAREGADPALVAYVAGEPGLDGPALRAALLDRLPEYMVPAAYRRVERMPLTRNHKADRVALAGLEPDFATAAAGSGRPPRTDLERSVAAIFGRLLDRPQVTIDDDFFALGGHSLLAMRLWGELRSDLGVDVELGQVMDNPTVAQLAELLARQPAVAARPRLVRRES